MTDWQPIDTAPRDGSEFLAFDAQAKKMDVCQMVNISTREPLWVCRSVQSDGEYGPSYRDFGYESRDITHWMPLPKPPAADGEQLNDEQSTPKTEG